MKLSPFDRETTLDLTVNMIPLGIMLFFVATFLLFNPWGTDLLTRSLQFGIVVVTFVLLAVLTYYAGKAISEAEAAEATEQSDATEPAS